MADEKILYDIEEFAFHMRQHALKMALAAGSHAVHFGGGMSMIEILAVLYCKVMEIDRNNPTWEGRDRFILSKGHGVIGYYAALRECGYLSDKDLECFEQGDSILMGHPVYCPEHGIEFTNGSLGMGLGLAVGTALAGNKRGMKYRTYVLIGDGELDEGSVWEGILSASQFGLENLCLIIDRNRLQLGGETESIMAHGNLKVKIESFGWNVFEADGHDIKQLYDTFHRFPKNGKPSAIIANTVKGKGFSFAEGNNSWHHTVMTAVQYEEACRELEENYRGNK